MASYTAEQLYGAGTPIEALTGGTEYTFTLTSPSTLLGSAYLTSETVRNADGFYDSSTPTNAVGTLSQLSFIQNPISDLYIFAVVANQDGASFNFTPTSNINVSSSFLRGTGGISLTISGGGGSGGIGTMVIGSTFIVA